MYQKILRVQKCFNSPAESEYQNPQCASVRQVNTGCFENQTSSFILMCDQKFMFLKTHQKQLESYLEMSIFPEGKFSTKAATEGNASLLTLI